MSNLENTSNFDDYLKKGLAKIKLNDPTDQEFFDNTEEVMCTTDTYSPNYVFSEQGEGSIDYFRDAYKSFFEITRLDEIDIEAPLSSAQTLFVFCYGCENSYRVKSDYKYLNNCFNSQCFNSNTPDHLLPEFPKVPNGFIYPNGARFNDLDTHPQTAEIMSRLRENIIFPLSQSQ